jgi:hypothetical protein
MGGLGSGRASGRGRDKVEALWSFDVNDLHRAGCLRPGYQGRWRSPQADEKIAEIVIRAEHSRLHFDCRTRISDGDWENRAEAIEIVRVPCRFGGERPYFVCQGGGLNGDGCGRRVGKLYRKGKRFLCRHCCRLTYESQCEDRLMRLRRKARKATERLDPRASSCSDVQRPKGMWRRTYERLRRRAFDLEMQAEDEFECRYAQMKERLGDKDGKKNPRR